VSFDRGAGARGGPAAGEPSGEAERLGVELERAALLQIRQAYEDVNGAHFNFALRPPTLELTRTQSFLGRWVSGTRTLQLDRSLLIEHSWGTLVEVLKHEMAHQYVDEVLGNPDGRPHGETFQRVCTERGIDFATRGIPTASGQSTPESKTLERIAKLLALAESQNLNEAQAAMSAARRLMLKHNIAQATAPGSGRYTFRHIGRPTGRRSAAERILGLILSEHFFVEVIWVPVWRPLEGKRGNVLEACGTLENLEIAAYVYDFLVHTAERLWREHKKARGLQRDAERQSFIYGVMRGFRAKLESEASAARQEGLVWVGDADLERYYRARHPYMRTTHVRAVAQGQAYRAGHAAGQRIVLHRGMRQGPSDPGRPRLLRGK
jgi:hypothetical protein